MERIILFTPVSTTDPITNFRDGSMLHICRVYHPDEVYLYLSAEMMKLHEMDQRYEYCIRKLAEELGCDIKIHYIMRPDLHDVQIYDIFYDDFRQIISKIQTEMTTEDILLVNIASGTPAMKSALLILAALSEYRFQPIQVTTPLRRSNRRDEKVEEYDVSTYWELNEDNEPEFENRCIEVYNKNFTALMKLEIIRKFVQLYDYQAALVIAKEILPWIGNDACRLIEAANARIMLDSRKVDQLISNQETDIIPIKSGNHRAIFEYALTLEIKLKKKEYADFLRALTPLTSELAEIILKVQCKINIQDYYTVNSKGVKRFDINQLKQNSEMWSVLNSEFGNNGGFHPSFVSTRQIVPLIRHYSKDPDLGKQADQMMQIEQKVRNLAAHDIISVTDGWIKQETGYTSKRIYEIIKKLIVKAGIKAKESDWESYNKMNTYILEKLRI